MEQTFMVIIEGAGQSWHKATATDDEIARLGGWGVEEGCRFLPTVEDIFQSKIQPLLFRVARLVPANLLEFLD